MLRWALLLALLAPVTVAAQQNRIDVVTPVAPELAAFGPHDIGVRTLQVTDRQRPDIVNIKEGGPTLRYDRPLTLEVWYPAVPGQKRGGEYHVVTRDPSVTATLFGRAARDAAPLEPSQPWPLVIVSHGYPGNRFLMSHIGENLASKGFVVAAIDHTDSTYDEQKAFASTLYNRPLDQLFVLNEIDRLSRPGSGSILSGIVDAANTAIIGYSMGGYGVVNAIGGGFSAASATFSSSPPNRMLAERGAASSSYQQSRDPRIKAAIAIGPWGMQNGFWDAEGLTGIRTPLMVVGGSVDEVSQYGKGIRAIYEGAVNADRYLLTFINAAHNAAAPIPAPAEVYLPAPGSTVNAFAHYADPVWDTVRMNNIFNHFATAFLGAHLQRDTGKQAYLDVVADGSTAVYSMDRNDRPTSSHTYWKGFRRGTAVGLRLEHAAPAR